MFSSLDSVCHTVPATLGIPLTVLSLSLSLSFSLFLSLSLSATYARIRAQNKHARTHTIQI
jgi:hypothetical protein